MKKPTWNNPTTGYSTNLHPPMKEAVDTAWHGKPTCSPASCNCPTNLHPPMKEAVDTAWHGKPTCSPASCNCPTNLHPPMKEAVDTAWHGKPTCSPASCNCPTNLHPPMKEAVDTAWHGKPTCSPASCNCPTIVSSCRWGAAAELWLSWALTTACVKGMYTGVDTSCGANSRRNTMSTRSGSSTCPANAEHKQQWLDTSYKLFLARLKVNNLASPEITHWGQWLLQQLRVLSKPPAF